MKFSDIEEGKYYKMPTLYSLSMDAKPLYLYIKKVDGKIYNRLTNEVKWYPAGLSKTSIIEVSESEVFLELI